MVDLDGYIDFDGTLTTSHSHFGLHVMGAKKELSKILKLGYYGLICLYKDKTGLDISSELEEMATVLEGLTFSRTSDLVEKMYVNENICIVRKILKKNNNINLTIITRNDKDFVDTCIERLQPELSYGFGINIIGVIGNQYKKVNGVYTGEVRIKVSNNKQNFFDGKPFFGDEQDGWKYKNYDMFVKV